TPSTRLSLSHMPPQLLEQAAARLSWVALVCAGTAVIMAVLQNLLQPEVGEIQKQFPIRINTAAVILLSLAIFALRRFGRAAPQTVLHLGLLLEVVGGFALATFDYSLRWDPLQ